MLVIHHVTKLKPHNDNLFLTHLLSPRQQNPLSYRVVFQKKEGKKRFIRALAILYVDQEPQPPRYIVKLAM